LRDGPRYSATTRGLIFLVVSRKLSNYAPFKGNMYLRVCTIGANHAICVLALRTLRRFSVQARLACVLERARPWLQTVKIWHVRTVIIPRRSITGNFYEPSELPSVPPHRFDFGPRCLTVQECSRPHSAQTNIW
jgi:hypothetical protein